MADPYEIAERVVNYDGRTMYVGRVPSDIEVLARALLAQRAVVEAAVAQRKALDAYKVECDKRYSLARDCAWETCRQACSETDTAVRAYLAEKEQK